MALGFSKGITAPMRTGGISKGINAPLRSISKGRASSSISMIPRTGRGLAPLSQTPQSPKPAVAPTGGASQSSGQPSPLDATYFANMASNTAKVNGNIAALNQANAYRDTDLQAALQKLAVAEPQNQLRLEQGANNRGALYSSVYQQGAGNLASQYAQQQFGLQQSHDRANAAATSQIGEDRQGLNDYAIQQALASTGRASSAASRDQTLGLLQSIASGGTPTASGLPAGTISRRVMPGDNPVSKAPAPRRGVMRLPAGKLSKGRPMRTTLTKGIVP